MHVSMMHIHMTLDPDACMYDAVMNDAYISKILYPDAYMHVSMILVYMILDPEVCVYDASMNDAYIHDPSP